MTVVSNTTPLIGLASIERLNLLHQLFGNIYIPITVKNELEIEEDETNRIKIDLLKHEWIKAVFVKDQLAVEVLLDELDKGEAETIVLAREIGAYPVLMDERKGRRKLTQLGIPKIGTVGLLLKAKQSGYITEIKDDLMTLRMNGFSISQFVIDAVLEQAGEL